jgi:hypothetical protein
MNDLTYSDELDSFSMISRDLMYIDTVPSDPMFSSSFIGEASERYILAFCVRPRIL